MYWVYRISSELMNLSYYGYTNKEFPLTKRLIEHKCKPNLSIRELIKAEDVQIFPLESSECLEIIQKREALYIKLFPCVNIRGKKLVTKDNTKKNNLDCKVLNY